MVIHRKKIRQDELLLIYKKAEAARRMRNKRNPALYTWDKFETWRKTAKGLLEQTRQGELSAEDFITAIKNE